MTDVSPLARQAAEAEAALKKEGRKEGGGEGKGRGGTNGKAKGKGKGKERGGAEDGAGDGDGEADDEAVFLEKDDVITHIDGLPMANDYTVRLRGDELVYGGSGVNITKSTAVWP